MDASSARTSSLVMGLDAGFSSTVSSPEYRAVRVSATDSSAAAVALRSAMQQDSSFMRDIQVTSSQKLTLVFGNAIVLVHLVHLFPEGSAPLLVLGQQRGNLDRPLKKIID